MKAVVQQILQWPIIVQGALGSALFWLIITIGERVVRRIGARLRGFSRMRRLEFLHAEGLRYQSILEDQDPQMAVLAIVGLIYGAIHYIIKALAAACLGFIFYSLFPVF